MYFMASLKAFQNLFQTKKIYAFMLQIHDWLEDIMKLKKKLLFLCSILRGLLQFLGKKIIIEDRNLKVSI